MHASLSASTRVYDHVKHRILDGALPGGELVTEGDLAEETGVSRTPVREALLRLEVEGLVRLYPKKGALVVPVTQDEARQVLQARGVIELWAAGQMWSGRSDVTPQLREQLAAMKAARAAGDVRAFVEHDRCFHEVIVRAAGNDILTRTYHGLRDRQLRILATQMRMSRSRMDTAVRGHAEIIELLASGSKADFLSATRQHVAVAVAAIRGVA